MRQVFLHCTAALLVPFIFGGTLLSQKPTKMSKASPIFGSHIPGGYRGYELIAPADEYAILGCNILIILTASFLSEPSALVGSSHASTSSAGAGPPCTIFSAAACEIRIQ
jgi:hypothetical protein